MSSLRRLVLPCVRTMRLGSPSLSRTLTQLVKSRVPSQVLNRQSSPAASCVLRCLATSAKFEVINVQDEEDFQKRVIEASKKMPVVVDFHAGWCGPCKVLGPRLESVMSKETDKVVMAKVDVDDNAEIAMEYGISSVPTVIGVKNGVVQNSFIGVIDEDLIQSFVDKLVVS